MQYLVLILSFSGIVGAEVTKDNARAHYYAHGHESAIRTTDWKCLYKHQHNVPFLLKKYETSEVSLALIGAAGDGDVNGCLSLILADADINRIDGTGSTPLSAAASHGCLETVKLLLKYRADSTMHDHGISFTPLSAAASRGDERMVNVLLYYSTLKSIRFALLEAVFKNRVNIANALLDYARINLNIPGGMRLPFTPLALACMKGHVECARLLIQRGADINAQDESDNTALHLALESRIVTPDCRKSHIECVCLLIQKGADINAKDESGSTALQLALKSGNQELIDLLTQAQAAAAVAPAQ